VDFVLSSNALYELGETQQACDGFQKAIALRFTNLKQAEKEKCEAIWKH